MLKSPNLIYISNSPELDKLSKVIQDIFPKAEIKYFESSEKMCLELSSDPTLIILTEEENESTQSTIHGIHEFNNAIPIIVISTKPTLKAAVKHLQAGASDYIPNDNLLKKNLSIAFNRLIKPERQNYKTNQTDTDTSRYSKFIVGNSKPIHKLFSLLDKAIKTNITVSIYGETGTGKEMIAKAIHQNSERSQHPFIPVNIAAIPDELIESELFGHEKGAFTGAIQQRLGKFEEAQNGTIFLDEIGEMDINMQSKLLRVLQEKEIVRIGGNQTIPLDVRIITATHRNLALAVKNKCFREDLYYRLLGLPIQLPPLRERGNDIILLSKYFLQQFAKENKLGEIRLSKEAQQKLMKYHYPGNVRELKSIIELAMVMSGTDWIKPNDITFNAVIPEEEWTFQEMTLKDYNTKIIKYYLEKYEDNIQEVSRRLDISRSTIYRYLKENEISQV